MKSVFFRLLPSLLVYILISRFVNLAEWFPNAFCDACFWGEALKNVKLSLKGYLVGSIPFGYLLVKYVVKKDVRHQGSGNIGATNVMRVGGATLAFLTFFLDAAKGWAVYKIAEKGIGSGNILLASWGPLFLGLMALIGHIAPLWLNFKGGKGIATFLGVILAWDPLAALVMLGVWASAFYLTRISAIGGLSASLVPLLMWLLSSTTGLEELYILVAMISLIWIRHKENLMRLSQGKEKAFKKKAKKDDRPHE